MRNIPGFVDTRQQLLQLKPSVKGHWLGFAVAHHLNGNHALAVQILDSFQQTQEEVPDNEQYEQSEIVMYKAMILKEGGKLEQALELLQSNKVCHHSPRARDDPHWQTVMSYFVHWLFCMVQPNMNKRDAHMGQCSDVVTLYQMSGPHTKTPSQQQSVLLLC